MNRTTVFLTFSISLLLLMTGVDMAQTNAPMNVSALWDFGNPGASEKRFEALLATTTDPDDRLQVETQIARAQGLQRKFPEAHKTLDEVEKALTRASSLTRVRYFLERGRVFNSSNFPAKAHPLFVQAYEEAGRAGLDYFEVDAAHMLGIIEPADEALKWNEKAVTLSEKSSDPKAKQWLGALYNNVGWTYYDKKDYTSALDYFQRDERWYAGHNAEEATRIARYSIGKTERAMGQLKDALMIQEAIAAEIEQKHLDPDGYVFEEIAECHLALGDPEQARPYFARAYELLSKDPDLAANERPRLERLKELSGPK